MFPSAPGISCVIPVFNGRRDLQRAVDSALAQRSDVEVILVDDCSTDGSRDLIVELARREPRITAVGLLQNRGQGCARNIGVAAAEARYVAFLDQDDEHLPGWYDHAIDVLDAHPQYAALRGGIELAELPADLSIDRADPRWKAIANSPIWNVVMRKLAYQAIGGSPTGVAFRTREGNEDWVLTETLKRHFPIAATEHAATRHYVKPEGATAYFLRRTRVRGAGFEFTEVTKVEGEGQLAQALAEFQRRAAANINALRAPVARPPGLFSRLLRRLSPT